MDNVVFVPGQFLSTLSLRRATALGLPGWLRTLISIHALLAESDFVFSLPLVLIFRFLSTLSLRRATARRDSRQQPAGISIHALLAESDVIRKPTAARNDKFLSTLSLRRATRGGHISKARSEHFYPRSPCGERPHCYQQTAYFFYFYPRSPCGERRGHSLR